MLPPAAAGWSLWAADEEEDEEEEEEEGGSTLEVLGSEEVGAGGTARVPPRAWARGAGNRKVPLLVFWLMVEAVLEVAEEEEEAEARASCSRSCCTSRARRSTGWAWLEETGCENAWSEKDEMHRSPW